MPELPEVESICIGLQGLIKNKKIKTAQFLTPHRLRQEIPKSIVKNVNNQEIIDIKRRAKYIQIELANDIIVIVHLGMSGKFLLKDPPYIFQKHDHFVFILETKEKLVYNDPRRFGLITYCKKEDLEKFKLFENLGLEPLSEKFAIPPLEEILLKSKKPIKLTLMDNKNIVGIGNIYACECLFLSKINPFRIANSISKKETELLYANIIKVLKEAIKAGGSTLKDFAHVNGESGYFQNNFFVYGRGNDNCKKCGNLIVKINQGGRSSFYCSHCQK